MTWSRRSCGRTRATRTHGPPDLFSSLPEDIRERLPRSVKDPSGDFETIYIDGQEFRRDLPKGDKAKKGLGINARPTGSREEDFINRVIGGNDPVARIKDLDSEGVWGEVMYPPVGIWTFNVRTPRCRQGGLPCSQRLGPRVPAALATLRLRCLHSPDRHRRRGGRGAAGPPGGVPVRFPPDPPSLGPAGVERRGVGPALGGLRGDGHGRRLPHRHRAARPHGAHGRLLPGPWRRRPQLCRDHLRRPTGGHAAHRMRRGRH